jgi:hypothetical protein
MTNPLEYQFGTENVGNPILEGSGVPDLSGFGPQLGQPWMPEQVRQTYQALNDSPLSNLRPAQLGRVLMGLGPAPGRPHVGPPPHPTMMFQEGTSNVPYVPITDPNDPRLTGIPLNEPATAPTAPTTAAAVTPAQIRARYALELQSPAVRRQLFERMYRETGGQGQEALQGFTESLFNRAASRNMTLTEAINDRNYFPKESFRPVTLGTADLQRYDKIVSNVMGGSNIANWATGNQSGNVKSGGAPIVFSAGGEGFVVENQDRPFIENLIHGKIPANYVAAPTDAVPGGWSPQQSSFGQIKDGTWSINPSGDYANAVAGTSGPTPTGEAIGRFGTGLSATGQSLVRQGEANIAKAGSEGMALLNTGNPYLGNPLSAYQSIRELPPFTLFGG